MGSDEGLVSLLFQKGHVAVGDQHGAVEAFQMLPGALHSVAGAQLRTLQHGGVVREGGLHGLGHEAGDQHGVFLRDEIQGLKHVVQQRLALGQTHDLGQMGGLRVHS